MRPENYVYHVAKYVEELLNIKKFTETLHELLEIQTALFFESDFAYRGYTTQSQIATEARSSAVLAAALEFFKEIKLVDFDKISTEIQVDPSLLLRRWARRMYWLLKGGDYHDFRRIQEVSEQVLEGFHKYPETRSGGWA